MSGLAVPSPRAVLLLRGLRLEYLTVGWNLVEGVIAVAAGLAAGSIALIGFGIDSFVESFSGSVLIWRLRAEQRMADLASVQRIEDRARRLVAVSFVILAAYLTVDAALALVGQERPAASPVGIFITTASIGVMWWLARAKRETALALGSRALLHDAMQTAACWWLSLVVLVGIGLNAVLGWWWADPVAALGIAFLLAREAREAWEGDESVEGAEHD